MKKSDSILGVLQENSMLRTAVTQSIDAVAVADLGGKILFVNPSWARMHGYDVEELTGKHLSMFHSEEQLKNDVLPFNEFVASKGSHTGPVGHLHREGHLIPTMMSVSVFTNSEGIPEGLVGHATDISERLRIEKELREAKELAEAGSRAKDAFLATVSHELRTPMNAIICLGEELVEAHLDGEQDKDARTILSSARNMVALLNDILDFSKIEAGRWPSRRSLSIFVPCWTISGT